MNWFKWAEFTSPEKIILINASSKQFFSNKNSMWVHNLKGSIFNPFPRKVILIPFSTNVQIWTIYSKDISQSVLKWIIKILGAIIKVVKFLDVFSRILIVWIEITFVINVMIDLNIVLYVTITMRRHKAVKLVLWMLVNEIRCWWHILVPNANVKTQWMLVTEMAETVTNIL